MTFDHLMAHAVALTAVLAEAVAPSGGGGGQNPLNMMTLMIPMLVIMYFVLFRPQRQKQKEAEQLQKAVTAGDEVITIGGAHGVITTVREKTVVLRMAEGKIEFDRSAIATRISKSEAPLATVEVVDSPK